jgi:hypothetical protein
VSYQTHDLAEWAAFLSLGVGVHAAFSVPYFLLVDADFADFDPRPLVRRAIESGRLVPVWQAAIHAGHTANRAYATGLRAGHAAADRAKHAPRDAAITAVALLMLLSIAPESAR